MCLIKDIGFHRNGRPLIAEKDIVCYKKLQQIRGNYSTPHTYFTPHTHVPVPIKCIRNKVPFEAKILHKFRFIWRHILGLGICVEDGFIHTYQEDDGYRSYAVFKCIIPKGTKYFIGRGGVYASEKIIFLKQMDIEQYSLNKEV